MVVDVATDVAALGCAARYMIGGEKSPNARIIYEKYKCAECRDWEYEGTG